MEEKQQVQDTEAKTKAEAEVKVETEAMAAENEVRVLSPEEIHSYDGITIEAGAEGQERREQEDVHRQERPKFYRTYVHYRHPGFSALARFSQGGWQGWLIKAALLAGSVAIIIFFLGFILPVLVAVAGVAVAAWLIWQLLG